ncbi:hypothetical protein B0H14DRAFT_2646822 [Mycena olivaceomarginata]|nr:hypothetical protein B0H14DRAFT_2646822 [Mycena olivaceomarginata]
MPPKQAKLDPETKAQRRREASACYRAKNPHLRDSARERMARLRSQVVDNDTKEARHAQKLQMAAAYRERNRKKTAQAEEECRRQAYIEHELKCRATKTPPATRDGHPSPHRPNSAVVTKTRPTLDADPPSDDEPQLLPSLSPKKHRPESDVDSDDSNGSACPWGPIHCPCVGDERCEECRICRCRAWWCKEDHPPNMWRYRLLQPKQREEAVHAEAGIS